MISTFPRNSQRDYCYDFQPELSHPEWLNFGEQVSTKILAAGTEATEGNNELFVFRREGGSWRIHRYLFATNQPQA